ncbi:polysaccharide lyase [Aquabacterium sp. A7-Y]|uniref:heparin lyase I family protein n=1 Tax=Aquabacterium sp. A7-Y TaxID=1349605 RepID=UPI00223DB190|nr:heparin lyase I family protein [Aquabacterium sp. A7-Y]MCW7540904.1 polysaccharide lyase [Aquabacterium sp. A7-Y]
MTRSRIPLYLLEVACAVALAACGGGADDGSTAAHAAQGSSSAEASRDSDEAGSNPEIDDAARTADTEVHGDDEDTATAADGGSREELAAANARVRRLIADGRTDTYTLIDRALGGHASETPDCAHPGFGPHITQAFDHELGKAAFVFTLHVDPDDDRCTNADRQRNEIKVYSPSDDYLKGFNGDTLTYRWRFKLDKHFQPSRSFTHIHQIKAVDGDDGSPIITLTPRAGRPEQLQLIHVDSKGERKVLAHVPLEQFKGRWIDAYERITYGSQGSYSLSLRNLADGKVLWRHSARLDMWRDGATFVRPKWGLYRSLDDREALRDESLRFDRFCIAKGQDNCTK